MEGPHFACLVVHVNAAGGVQAPHGGRAHHDGRDDLAHLHPGVRLVSSDDCRLFRVIEGSLTATFVFC